MNQQQKMNNNESNKKSEMISEAFSNLWKSSYGKPVMIIGGLVLSAVVLGGIFSAIGYLGKGYTQMRTSFMINKPS